MKKRRSGKIGPGTVVAVKDESPNLIYTTNSNPYTATGTSVNLTYTSSSGNWNTTTANPGTIWTIPSGGTTPFTYNFPVDEEHIAAVLRSNDKKPAEATLDWSMEVSPEVLGILKEEDHETRKILHGIACGKPARKLEMRVKGLPVEIVKALEGTEYEYCTECRAIF